MAKRAKFKDDGGPEVPAWVVSFADMITLLLAFFVMLQAFALEQQPDLFLQGQGAFRRSIAGLGIPSWLLGSEAKPDAKDQKKRYQTEEEDRSETRKRLISARDQKIRLVFRELKDMIETRTDQQQAELRHVMRVTTRFAPGKASLNNIQRENLVGLADTLRQNLNEDVARICVFGWANDVPDGKDRWLVASRRAEAVADVLRNALARKMGKKTWRIISMGGGPNRAPKGSSQEFVRIVIMKAK